MKGGEILTLKWGILTLMQFMESSVKKKLQPRSKRQCSLSSGAKKSSFLLQLSLTTALITITTGMAISKETLAQPPSSSELIPPALAEANSPLRLLGETLLPGAKKRLFWTLGHTFEGTPISAPVLIVNGSSSGPTLCLAAAIHGDEINGIATVHQIITELEPRQLRGAVIGVPIANLHAYRQNSRYLPDRRDLNRHFPGKPNGNSAARIAHSFFQQIVIHCHALIDLHTGSFHRTNLPQVRADLRNLEVLRLARGFTNMAIVHSEGLPGSLRRAATEAGIPSLTLEAGEPQRLQRHAVEQSVRGITALMQRLAMVSGTAAEETAPLVFHQSKWIRADQAGILLSEIQLGDAVKPGQQLGIITDPITHQATAILSPYNGYILGMALNQVMLPGYAAYHIGVQAKQPAPSDESLDHVASTESPTYLVQEE